MIFTENKINWIKPIQHLDTILQIVPDQMKKSKKFFIEKIEEIFSLQLTLTFLYLHSILYCKYHAHIIKPCTTKFVCLYTLVFMRFYQVQLFVGVLITIFRV